MGEERKRKKGGKEVRGKFRLAVPMQRKKPSAVRERKKRRKKRQP